MPTKHTYHVTGELSIDGELPAAHHSHGRPLRSWSVVHAGKKYDVTDFTNCGMKITAGGEVVWSGERVHGGHYRAHSTTLSEGTLAAVLELVKAGDERHAKAPPVPRAPVRKVRVAREPEAGAEAEAARPARKAKKKPAKKAAPKPKPAPKHRKKPGPKPKKKPAAKPKAARKAKAKPAPKPKARKAPKSRRSKGPKPRTAAQLVGLQKGRLWRAAKRHGLSEAAFNKMWEEAGQNVAAMLKLLVAAGAGPKTKGKPGPKRSKKRGPKTKAGKKPKAKKGKPGPKPKKPAKKGKPGRKPKAPKGPKAHKRPKNSKAKGTRKPKTRTPAQIAALAAGRQKRHAGKPPKSSKPKSAKKAAKKPGPKKARAPKASASSKPTAMTDHEALAKLKSGLEKEGRASWYDNLVKVWGNGGKKAAHAWMKAHKFANVADAFVDWVNAHKDKARAMMTAA